MEKKNTSFPRESRLTSKINFDRVFASPLCAVKTPFFSIYACRSELAYPRLGISVAKRRFKQAVVRNRLRRLIRENFRQCQAMMPGVDVVVVVKKNFDLLQQSKYFGEQMFQGVCDKLQA